MTYFLLFLALSSNAVANILMKLGSVRFADGLGVIFKDPMVFLKNGYFWGALLFFATALVLYALVLSKMQLSVAYPIMTSVGFVIVLSFSVYYLNEQLWWWQWLAIAMILLGVVVLSQGKVS